MDGKRTAYAYVELAHPKMVGSLKDKFKNFWIEDKKIKMKAREDLSYETFERRTLIIENIPVNYKEKDIINMI